MTDLDSLPSGEKYIAPERIVSAANQYGDIIITGVRHGSDEMVDAFEAHMNSSQARALLDQWLHTYSQTGHEIKTELSDELSEALRHELRDFIQKKEVQGFITNKYRFVTREEAWHIAAANDQIKCRVPGDTRNGGRLFSENMY